MRELPLTDTETVSEKIVNGSWTSKRTHSTLLRSTGHPKKDGHYVGDDDFHVHRDVETPGLGPWLNFTAGPDLRGPIFPFNGTYSWRPVLTRQYNSEYYLVDDPGVYHPLYHDLDYPDVAVPDTADYLLDLNSVGTSFIRQARPGNPVANLGQFTGELHDLPRIPFLKSQVGYLATLGHEFLNIEFGWKPLVKDLKKAYALSLTLDQRLSRLVKNNGIPIKQTRSKKTPEDVVLLLEGSRNAPFADLSIDNFGDPSGLGPYVVMGPGGALFLDSGGDGFTGSIEWKLERVRNRVDWYSGVFEYYVPDIGTLEWTEKARLALYEANVTPSVLYELFPWSWLADWFANVGDIISNLSTNAVDNEVLVRSYVMSRQSEEMRLTAKTAWDEYSSSFQGNPVFLASGNAELVSSHLKLDKLRHPASPFGFGINSEAFSTRQWFILAALGLTSQHRL